MEELEEYIKEMVRDFKSLSDGEYIITPFLDETYQKRLEDAFKYNKKASLTKNGKIINSVRNRIIIKNIDDNINPSFDIELFKINYNKKYESLDHRSILGSLMGLGIKRECIGDIIKDNDDNWYFASTKEISSFILSNFTSVGRNVIDITKTDIDLENIINFEYKNFFLSSLRLDLVVKDAFYIPRSVAQKAINEGIVYVNHLPILDNDYKTKIGDEINLRGKGKVKLIEELGTSKSGKLVVKIGRFI